MIEKVQNFTCPNQQRVKNGAAAAVVGTTALLLGQLKYYTIQSLKKDPDPIKDP